jgi:hypothetical protein
MAALWKRDVGAGSIGRVVGRVSIVGGDGMPEGAPGLGDATRRHVN